MLLRNWQKENRNLTIILVILCSLLLAFLLGLHINLEQIKNEDKIQEVPVISPDHQLLQDKYLRLPDDGREQEAI